MSILSTVLGIEVANGILFCKYEMHNNNFTINMGNFIQNSTSLMIHFVINNRSTLITQTHICQGIHFSKIKRGRNKRLMGFFLN